MPDHVFPCDACGAQLRFAPGETVLACPSCGHAQAIPEAENDAQALREIDYAAVVTALERGAAHDERPRVLACPSCGARTEFPEGVQATACPFCATPLIAEPARSRQIRPAALIPFALDERELPPCIERRPLHLGRRDGGGDAVHHCLLRSRQQLAQRGHGPTARNES